MDDKGPSWFDAARAVSELGEAWGLAVHVELVPNWRLDDRARFGAWVVCCTLRRRGESQGRLYGASCSFGKGGDRSTAPGALLVCTARLWADLEEAKRLAESQASF